MERNALTQPLAQIRFFKRSGGGDPRALRRSLRIADHAIFGARDRGCRVEPVTATVRRQPVLARIISALCYKTWTTGGEDDGEWNLKNRSC